MVIRFSSNAAFEIVPKPSHTIYRIPRYLHCFYSVWPDWAICWTLGIFKAFGNNYFFVKVLKSIIFLLKSHFGLLLYTFGDCFLVTLLLFYTQMTTHFQSFFTTQQLTLYLSISRLTTLALYFIVFFAFTVSLDHSIHKYFPTLSVSLIRKSKLFADPGTPTQTHTQLAKTIQ